MKTSLKQQLSFSVPIAFATGDTNYTKLHYVNGEDLLIAKTLAVVMQKYPYLIRIHKKYAINPAYVLRWNRYSPKGMTVFLTRNGRLVSVEVARRRVHHVHQELESWLLKPDES